MWASWAIVTSWIAMGWLASLASDRRRPLMDSGLRTCHCYFGARSSSSPLGIKAHVEVDMNRFSIALVTLTALALTSPAIAATPAASSAHTATKTAAPAETAKPATHKKAQAKTTRCRDAHGHFARCGTAGARASK